MKYMGSKALLLNRGLGDLIRSEARGKERFIDLFSGAAHVAYFAARNTNIPVTAVDLQNYASVLAGAVVERIQSSSTEYAKSTWLRKAVRSAKASQLWKLAVEIDAEPSIIKQVSRARQFCSEAESVGPVLGSYGGYYFSPSQSLILDYMLEALPTEGRLHKVLLATIICVASRCAAAPGHTAQPFQATDKGKRYLREAWERDPVSLAEHYLEFFCNSFANRRGCALTGDAVVFSKSISPQDLVFIDPPYSDVQYSRFYHVLETIAAGKCGEVSGSGRYPPTAERPQSAFSKKTTSLDALERLLHNLGEARATVIFTFPGGLCSNGLSGKVIEENAGNRFSVSRLLVNGQFSTLGGNNSHRKPTQKAEEWIMILRPKSRIITVKSSHKKVHPKQHDRQRQLPFNEPRLVRVAACAKKTTRLLNPQKSTEQDPG